MIPLIIIEGPTAVGKSELALSIAEMIGSQIISADSRQVFRYLNIGTAKPSLDEQARIKHHLIDVIDPGETYNSGRFVCDANEIINELWDEGSIPVVCGGTGLYVKALLEGLFSIPPIPLVIRQRLEERLINESLGSLYEELKGIDHEFACRISVHDKQRIQRGLEVFYGTGKPISMHWIDQERNQLYKPYRILLYDDREALYQRINNRVRSMLNMGLLEEIRSILSQGYTASTIGLQTLGYKEFMPYLLYTESLDKCIETTQQKTRNYAKRQMTWYRKYNFDLTIRPSEIRLSSVMDSLAAVIQYPRAR